MEMHHVKMIRTSNIISTTINIPIHQLLLVADSSASSLSCYNGKREKDDLLSFFRIKSFNCFVVRFRRESV
jgi:hypothetical protein